MKAYEMPGIPKQLSLKNETDNEGTLVPKSMATSSSLFRAKQLKKKEKADKKAAAARKVEVGDSESEDGYESDDTEESESESEDEPVGYTSKEPVKKLTPYEKKREKYSLDSYEVTPEELGIPDRLKYYTSV
jgi:hypothetical protein